MPVSRTGSRNKPDPLTLSYDFNVTQSECLEQIPEMIVPQGVQRKH